MSLEAANPYINATVTASAGSGKTYMLVTRIVRLLLEDAEPGSILALTFTRKAAAEMQQRLSERLYQLATVDDAPLNSLLKDLGVDATYKQKARRLYEAHQYCDYPVRTLTFHSFCQDLLARFPLEANVPPNFDLLESADLLIKQARDALYNDATLDMQGELAGHLQSLMTHCGGLFNLDKILNNFLAHRSDWWAYTFDNHEPNNVEFACEQLAQQLELPVEILNSDIYLGFFTHRALEQLKNYAQLLPLNPTKTNLKKADGLANILALCISETEFNQRTFQRIKAIFIKKDGDIFALKDTPTLRKKMGDDNAETLLELHQLISSRILDILDTANKIHTYQLNYHWFYCGEKFIAHYQMLKNQQRLLDFTDLEWSSYTLLQDPENALWIQYKLDQQIQHLLIDEFQDTNPTQWQLILPLLEEMAASEPEQHRSVFLVGDEKQSIYSFRRAKPELQQQASDWLAQHLNAQAFPLNKSWRSSPAIINTVNAVFSQAEYKINLPTFIEHHTHHQTLYGRVEVLPLWHSSDLDAADEAVYCRDPLTQPRAVAPGLHEKEALQIAQHIQQLIKDKTIITEGNQQRPVNYNDIFILVRKRAHVADYERALRNANIAYLGTNRGTFLSCLEIQDMEALLDTLLTPFNNLSLAQILKSPLFSATDDDLQRIAVYPHKGPWFERLPLISQELNEWHPITRAWHYLSTWQKLADKIPVHDLLDKIFSQADVLERYKRSTPKPLQARVQANLTLFLEMALDLDSGRYPSLMHFLFHLRSLKSTPGDAPDEAPMETHEPRVRIMTIHASKGLEAPVVYLADTVNINKDKSALSTLVDWPVEDKKPRLFMLLPSNKQQDNCIKSLNQHVKQAAQKEDANLLYVAITRARQYCFISGCQPDKGPFSNWYQPLLSALQTLTHNEDDPHLSYCFGEQPLCETPQSPAVTTEPYTPDIALTQIIKPSQKKPAWLAPSHEQNTNNLTHETASQSSQTARQRGIAIHRLLELLAEDINYSEDDLLQRIAFEMPLENNAPLSSWYNLAKANIDHPDLKLIFNNKAALQIFNECPVQYRENTRLVHGIIDRLIVEPDQIIIVDYKTHSHANKNNMQDIALEYQSQMQYYANGIKSIWPDKTIRAYLLFTECTALTPVKVH